MSDIVAIGGWRRWALRALGAVVFVLAWQLLSILAMRELPTPVGSAQAFVRLILHAEPVLGRTLLQHTGASVARVVAGTALAAAVAIPLGLVRGRIRTFDEVATPGTEMLRPIPPIAWIPLASIIFVAMTGSVVGVKLYIVFVGAFFPILLNTLHGARGVDPVFIDVARSFRASRRQLWRTVVIPAALPSVVTGLRIGLGVAWMSIMAAEMIGGSASGLGYFVLAMYTVGGDTPAIVAGMGAIGLVGFAMNEVLVSVSRRALRWL